MSTKLNNLLIWFNNHSKQIIVATIIVVGAAVTASASLWYYRNYFKTADNESNVVFEVASESAVKEALTNRTTDGTINSLSGNKLTLKTTQGELLNLNIVAETTFTKGTTLAEVALTMLKNEMKVSVLYNPANNNIKNIWVEE